jgi:hypothetical protein
VRLEATHADAVWLRRAWTAYVVGTVALGVVVAIRTWWPFSPEALDEVATTVAMPFVSGIVLAALLAVVAARSTRSRELGAARVRVDGGALHVAFGGRPELVLGPAELRQGLALDPRRLFVDAEDGRRVHLALSEDRARTLLELLGLDAARRALVFRWRSWRARTATAATCAVIVILPFAVFAMLPHGFHALSYGIEHELGLPGLELLVSGTDFAIDALARATSDRELRIGLDGITETVGARVRSFRFADVLEVRSALDVVLELRGGGEARLRADVPGEDLRVAIDERIRASRAIAKWLSDDGRALSGRLRKGERSIAEWCAAVRLLLDARGGFRDAASFGPDDVLTLALDPSADVEARLGAALAIGAAGDEKARSRIREAARACASAALGDALASAVSDAPDEAVITTALAATA